MCHPGDHEYMPVDTTWGIMPSSGIRSSIFKLLIVCARRYSNRLLSLFSTVQDRPQALLE